MNMPTPSRSRTRRSAPQRPAQPRRSRSIPAPVASPTRQAGVAEQRARLEGGPRDIALYACPCGTQFEAPVSASVECPRCGAGQSW